MRVQVAQMFRCCMYVLMIACFIGGQHSVAAQFTIISNPPTANLEGDLHSTFTIQFTPRTVAKQFRTTIQYTDPDACASTGGTCSGELILDAPYYKHKMEMQEILCSNSNTMEVTVYAATNVQLPGQPDFVQRQGRPINESLLDGTELSPSSTSTPSSRRLLSLPEVRVRDVASGKSVHMDTQRLLRDEARKLNKAPSTVQERLRARSIGYAVFSQIYNSDYALHASSSGSQRRLLQSSQSGDVELERDPLTGGPVNSRYSKGFSNADIYPALVHRILDENEALRIERTKGVSAQEGVTRQQNTFALVANMNRLFSNISSSLVAGIQAGTEAAEAQNRQLQDLMSQSETNIKVQEAILRSINHTRATLENDVQVFGKRMEHFGYLLLKQQSELLAANAMQESQRLFLSRFTQSVEQQNNMYAIEISQLTQLVTLGASIARDISNNVIQSINDPTQRRELTLMLSLAVRDALDQSKKVIVDRPGVTPVKLTDAQKYEEVMNGAYWYPVATNLRLSSTNVVPSWKLVRMYISVECDVTHFAATLKDQSTYAAVLQWFGPENECENNPLGACHCRMFVSYQETRNREVLQWYRDGLNATERVIETPVDEFHGAPHHPLLVPHMIQQQMPLYHGQGQNEFSPSDTSNDNYGANDTRTLYRRPYRERWLYNLAQVQSELESNCLSNVLALSQLPDHDASDVYTASLKPDPFNSVAGSRREPSLLPEREYYVRGYITGQSTMRMPVGVPLWSYDYGAIGQMNVTNAPLNVLRPQCRASVDSVQTYRSLGIPTFGAMLYDAQIVSYRAWLPRLVVQAKYMMGTMFSPVEIHSEDFAFQRTKDVNDTLSRADTATFAVCSQDGTPSYRLYDRTSVIRARFVPDSRSVNLVEHEIPSNSIVWDASDVTPYIPDSMTLVGYPRCIFEACPYAVRRLTPLPPAPSTETNLVMNDTASVSAVGGQIASVDASTRIRPYTYNVPYMSTSMDGMRRRLAPNYMRKYNRMSELSELREHWERFDGPNTRYVSPSYRDWMQSSRGHFSPLHMGVSLGSYLQPLDVEQYTVDEFNVDGARLDTFPLVSCVDDVGTGTDLTMCHRWIRSYPSFDEDGDGAFRHYPYNYKVSKITLKIPTGARVSLPAPIHSCPSDISFNYQLLEHIEVKAFNPTNRAVGPFQILISGCSNNNSSSTTTTTATSAQQRIDVPTLGPWRTEILRVPGCATQVIRVQSAHVNPLISTPVLCNLYRASPQIFTPSTVKEGMQRYVKVTRDSVFALSKSIFEQILSSGATRVANNMSRIIVDALYTQRSQQLIDVHNDIIRTTSDTIQQLQENLKNDLFAREKDNQQMLARLYEVELRVQRQFALTQSQKLLVRLNKQLIDQNAKYIQEELALLPSILNVTRQLDIRTARTQSYDYLFADTDIVTDWSSPTFKAMAVFLNDYCFMLHKVPPYHPDPDDCQVTWYSPRTYFDCIPYEWFGIVTFIQFACLVILLGALWRKLGSSSFNSIFTMTNNGEFSDNDSLLNSSQIERTGDKQRP